MSKYFMGIDIGTRESKGVIVDENMHVVVSSSTPHDLENPKPNYFEHDAEQVWWGDFCILSHRLLKVSGIPSNKIAGVGVSALSADVVPVDENCIPLRKAILYGIDARAVEEEQYMTSYYGEKRMKELFDGRPLCSSDCMPKILWIRNHEPEIFQKTYKFLTASSYLTAKLTDQYVIDRYLCISSFAPCYKNDLSIDSNLSEELFCRADQLAEGKETADVVGTVTTKASMETGLAPGTPVVTGTDDSGAEAISTGIFSPGDFMVQLGSTCYLICCCEHIISDDRIWSEDYLVPNTFCMDGGTNTAGSLIKWIRDTYFQDYIESEKNGGTNAYQAMYLSAQNVSDGSKGLIILPYFAGERTPLNDSQAKGVIFGLQLHHTREHIYYAALESVGFSIAQHIKIFEEHGAKISKFYVTGGGTKNPLWLQIIADITGKTVCTCKVINGACYGDAMIAAVGTGLINDYKDLSQYIESDHEYIPNHIKHKKYLQSQKIFDELYETTKSLMHRIS